MGQVMVDQGPMGSPPSQDWRLDRAKFWTLRLCWLPKKCFLTQKSLWGKWAYHGERWIAGPGEPVVEHYWIEKDEFIMWQLKK